MQTAHREANSSVTSNAGYSGKKHLKSFAFLNKLINDVSPSILNPSSNCSHKQINKQKPHNSLKQVVFF